MVVPLAVLSGCTGATQADEPTRVIVDSWGGAFQDDQTALIFEPFHKESGTEVVQLSDGENIYAKVEAQADRKTGEIDLVHGDASWLVRGKTSKLWAPIDQVATGTSSVYDDARDENGVGILYYSYNIVYNNKAIAPDDAPQSWADVWAYARAHPGRVALFGPRPNYLLEIALMADGVAPDEVYPLTAGKIDRAYASLDAVRDSVVFYEGGGDGGNQIKSGEVDISMFYGGDAFALIDDGAPLTVVWNQGLYTRDYWMIPANAPHPKAAEDLIKFAVQPQVQADFAAKTGYGPVVPEAADSLPEAVRTRMASLEPQKSLQVAYDYNWWGTHDDEQLKRYTAWSRG